MMARVISFWSVSTKRVREYLEMKKSLDLLCVTSTTQMLLLSKETNTAKNAPNTKIISGEDVRPMNSKSPLVARICPSPIRFRSNIPAEGSYKAQRIRSFCQGREKLRP